MNEHFSLKEMKPLTLADKKLRIETKIAEVQEQRDNIAAEINDLNNQLAEISAEIRGNRALPQTRYDELCMVQFALKKAKSQLDKQILPVKNELRKLHLEKDAIHNDMKKIPSDKAMQKAVEIRDKYLSFAADTTRVSSMRAMASKFVEEIQSLIPYLPQ